ncbi:MAG: AbrB/MazE/SpoVT family DNA-binding domain-containing protein [Brachymonas sp.]|nr:AbrB/MazE/SpoVT family DNA-binding domain-containing protein [Brachymonas sp.]
MTADTLPDTAKVFMSGRSQAVRLPKAYRFDTDEVTIEKVGDAVVLRAAKPAAASPEARRKQLLAILDRFEGMPESIERDQSPARDLPSWD